MSTPDRGTVPPSTPVLFEERCPLAARVQRTQAAADLSPVGLVSYASGSQR
jgi:hypothetical protein